MPVTENLSAPPSPLPLQYGPQNLATYRPVLFMYDIQNNNYIYSQIYSNSFIDFLRKRRITCNAKTKVYILKEQIKLMFLLMYDKTVTDTIFSRNNIKFKNKNTLGNYSQQIEAWDNNDNIKDFFKISVKLQEDVVPQMPQMPQIFIDTYYNNQEFLPRIQIGYLNNLTPNELLGFLYNQDDNFRNKAFETFGNDNYNIQLMYNGVEFTNETELPEDAIITAIISLNNNGGSKRKRSVKRKRNVKRKKTNKRQK